MKGKYKRLWLERLATTEQGQDALAPTQGTGCCLGVACDVAATEGIGCWHIRPGASLTFAAPGEDPLDGAISLLPEEVQKLFGLDDPYGWSFTVPQLRDVCTASELRRLGKSFDLSDAAAGAGRTYGLAELNDAGLSFPTIAKLIDKYIPVDDEPAPEA